MMLFFLSRPHAPRLRWRSHRSADRLSPQARDGGDLLVLAQAPFHSVGEVLGGLGDEGRLDGLAGDVTSAHGAGFPSVMVWSLGRVWVRPYSPAMAASAMSRGIRAPSSMKPPLRSSASARDVAHTSSTSRTAAAVPGSRSSPTKSMSSALISPPTSASTSVKLANSSSSSNSATVTSPKVSLVRTTRSRMRMTSLSTSFASSGARSSLTVPSGNPTTRYSTGPVMVNLLLGHGQSPFAGRGVSRSQVSDLCLVP